MNNIIIPQDNNTQLVEFTKKYSPSEWVGEVEYTSITRLRIACEGYISGRQRFEYVSHIKQIPSNSVVRFVRYDGKKIAVNTRYLVDAEDFMLGIAKLDITKWKETHNNADTDKLDDIQTYYILLNENAELKLIP